MPMGASAIERSKAHVFYLVITSFCRGFVDDKHDRGVHRRGKCESKRT